MRGLVVRLKSVHAHREYPWSSTRHFVSNVRVLGDDGNGDVHAEAAFQVWRFRNRDENCFVGRYNLRLRPSDGGELRLVEKRITLDAWTLAPMGAISIVL
jgi:p-cumate 2,3-dioxygenase beta subunit